MACHQPVIFWSHPHPMIFQSAPPPLLRFALPSGRLGSYCGFPQPAASNVQPSPLVLSQGLTSASGSTAAPSSASVGTEFTQGVLRTRHEGVINSLYTDKPRQCKTCGMRFTTQAEHSKHMDWHVVQNRKKKARMKASRTWFPKAKDGTSAAAAEVPFFARQKQIETADEEQDDDCTVPADENQRTCALCLEPFEDFFSDEMDEWVYRGAVYKNVPPGTYTEGMSPAQLGPIVHAKCRAGPVKKRASYHTSAAAELPPPPLSAQEKRIETKVEECTVPADENQTTCALCLEPFEDFFSDEMDEWRYRDAVYKNVAPGTYTEGMSPAHLGPIVHAKCRATSEFARAGPVKRARYH